MKRTSERLRSQDGFTLIELMVVVLIIAILIAIAIPTFLGARERAQNRAAQSSLRNTVTAAKTIFTDNEDYNEATVDELGETEPSLTFSAQAVDSTDQNEVSVVAVSDNRFVAAALASTGTCWYVQDITNAPPPAGMLSGTSWASAAGPDCSADDGVLLPAASWERQP